MAGQGGKRPGAGRKQGAVNKLSKKAIEEAKATGELPHERLLKISRGEPVLHHRKVEHRNKKTGQITKVEYVEELHYPSFKEQVIASEAAAPYYAPKLLSQKIDLSVEEKLKKMSDAELEAEKQKLLNESKGKK